MIQYFQHEIPRIEFWMINFHKTDLEGMNIFLLDNFCWQFLLYKNPADWSVMTDKSNQASSQRGSATVYTWPGHLEGNCLDAVNMVFLRHLCRHSYVSR